MNRFLALLTAALVVSIQLKAQALQEIIDRHITAVGGDAAWKNVHVLKYIGSTSSNGTKVPYTRTVLDGKGLRYDMELSGRPSYIIYTPERGWTLFALSSDVQPSEIPEQMVKSAYSELFVSDQLMGYQAKGARVTYEGMEKVEGNENYKLKYTDKWGNISILYVDPTTYHITHKSQKMRVGTKETEHMQTFMHYTTLPKGVVVAKEIRGGAGEGITVYDTVEVNTMIDEGIFKP